MKLLTAASLMVCLLCVQLSSFAQVKILTNHLGYAPDAPKRAIILAHKDDQIGAFKVVDSSGKEAFAGEAVKVGPVDQWKDWVFWTADFSSVKSEGTYILLCVAGAASRASFPINIRKDLLERETLSSVMYYFKGQRCSGLLDRADAKLKFADTDSDQTVDVHGGWFDATGDYGKHLSHLSFSTYFNPQQIPMADWSLLKTYQSLTDRG